MTKKQLVFGITFLMLLFVYPSFIPLINLYFENALYYSEKNQSQNPSQMNDDSDRINIPNAIRLGCEFLFCIGLGSLGFYLYKKKQPEMKPPCSNQGILRLRSKRKEPISA